MKKRVGTIVATAVLLVGSAFADGFKAVNIGPLVTSVWNQTWPYVNFAPVNRSSHEHMPNGCVAVALSQTMRYWDWPTRIEETWLGSNFADGVPGFEQRILAGTEIDWASMLNDYLQPSYADFLTLGKGQVLTSIVVEMKFKKLAAGADASRFDRNPWFLRTTEMNNVEGSSGAPPYAERYARVREALTNGIPLLCTVDVGNIGHEIIVDGWRETNDTDGEVHVNYGWGGLSNEWRPFKTCGVKTVMFGFVPRPKVIATPLIARAALPLAVRWHFPKKGYEKTLKGFALSYAEAMDETETWQDGFETQQGSVWGEGITREIVAGCGEASDVLRIDNASDRSTYTWPAKLMGTEAELSFRYRSDRAKNQSVLVEAYEASHGWRTLESLALCPDGTANWMSRTISLADYAGKATAIRFRTERAGVGADKIIGSPQFGVQIDDMKITNVRKLNPSKTLWGDAETRACALGGDVLEVGKTYVITVSPDVPNGESGYGVATTIVGCNPEKAGIVGVQSLRKTGYQFHAGIYRDCYIGTNQFAVYTTEATTKLTVSLSHPTLIDEILVDDVAVPGTKTLSPSSVSLANAVKIEKCASGKWLVTLDFSDLTDASRNAQEIVTIEAEDADGNVARKEVYVCLVQQGDETPIEPSDIPAYAGTDESGDGALPPLVHPPTPDDPDNPIEETPVVTTTFPKADDAGPNDDATAKTRFCPGIKNASSGVYDVTRTGAYNYLIPSGHNLLYWWIARYKTAHEDALPSDYLEQSSPESQDSTYTLQSYTAKLLDNALKVTLPAGKERAKYFPTTMIAAEDWQDDAADDGDKLTALGRHIYSSLANGPIGIQISTFKVYGAVIWGCEYAESSDGNYATALYITDTVLNTRTDTAVRKELKMTSNNYNSGAGLLNFNGSTSGIIEHLYPISGPEPESSGNGEVTVKATARGKEYDISKAFSKVEKGAGNVITYTLDVTPGKKIVVDGEQIPIQPEFANDENETPFEVQNGKFVFKVKSIPGLKYQVLASDSLDPNSFTPAGKEREATGTRRELTVTRPDEIKGFFKIRVSR